MFKTIYIWNTLSNSAKFEVVETDYIVLYTMDGCAKKMEAGSAISDLTGAKSIFT